MDAVASLDAALDMIRDDGAGDQELMAIGGGDVFALALPIASRMYLTHVDTLVADADAFFLAFDASRWHAVSREAHVADAKHAFAFEFVDYERGS